MSELLPYFLGRVRGLLGNAVFFHTHQEEPTEAAVPESYEDWRDGFAKERLLIFYSVALISNPVWVALDYLHGSQFSLL